MTKHRDEPNNDSDVSIATFFKTKILCRNRLLHLNGHLPLFNHLVPAFDAVSLVDINSLEGPFCSATGITIDFAEAIGTMIYAGGRWARAGSGEDFWKATGRGALRSARRTNDRAV